jgi:hypothetical protein
LGLVIAYPVNSEASTTLEAARGRNLIVWATHSEIANVSQEKKQVPTQEKWSGKISARAKVQCKSLSRRKLATPFFHESSNKPKQKFSRC